MGKSTQFETIKADARHLEEVIENPSLSLGPNSADLIVTSPPYWTQRDYEHEDQIGSEPTLNEYADTLACVLESCKTILKPTGSLFLNLGDTYVDKSLVSAPSSVLQRALNTGWRAPNTIQWVKTNTRPDPAPDRLKNQTERVYWLTTDDEPDYVTKPSRFAQEYGEADVWKFPPSQSDSGHAAPYPEDLVNRALTVAAPDSICTSCGTPQVEDDPLTESRWSCPCDPGETENAVVYDPFVGTGTTIEAAVSNGHDAIGTDLRPDDIEVDAQTSLEQFEPAESSD